MPAPTQLDPTSGPNSAHELAMGEVIAAVDEHDSRRSRPAAAPAGGDPPRCAAGQVPSQPRTDRATAVMTPIVTAATRLRSVPLGAPWLRALLHADACRPPIGCGRVRGREAPQPCHAQPPYAPHLRRRPATHAALLAWHPIGRSDLFELVYNNLTPWLAIHYAGLVFFPVDGARRLAADPGCTRSAATIARWALPVFAVFFAVWEAIFELPRDRAHRPERAATSPAPSAREPSPPSRTSSRRRCSARRDVFIGRRRHSRGGTGVIAGAILALTARRCRAAPPLILFGIGGLLVFHVPIGPPALDLPERWPRT